MTINYSIVNIVAKSHIGEIILNEILELLNDAAFLYKTKQNGIFYKSGDLSGTFFIYNSGAIAVRGGKNINEVNKAFEKLIRKLKNYNVLKDDFNPILEIVNIVAIADLKTKINLEVLISELENTNYNPEVFPGLTYKIPNSSTMLIFSTGKIVIFARNTKNIEKAIMTLREVI